MSSYEWEEAADHNPWGKKRKRGTHCSKGHEFTPENTFTRAYDKARVCRECRKQYAREKYQRKKELTGTSRTKKIRQVIIEYENTLSKDAIAKWHELQEAMEFNTPKCAGNTGDYADQQMPIDEDAAEQMCHGCPLIKLCYDYAVAAEVNQGVWGGIDFTQEEEYDLIETLYQRSSD